MAADLGDVHDVALRATRLQVDVAVFGHPVAALLSDGRRRVIAHGTILHVTEGTAPAITGIHHFSVTVCDIETSAAWYQRVFRAQRVPMTFPHYEREDTGYGVLLLEPGSGLAIGLHTNTGNDGAQFDEARTGLDHVGFNVDGREELERWAAWLGELDIEHSGIRTGDEPFPYATLVFRDPDNIQLELFAVV
jgi:catechol 2,3-dioxygenase-like lactoylglutathione lyase family enzyme